MKKQIRYLLTFTFLIISLFSFNVSAETKDTVSFQITEGDVGVSLRLPEGKYEKITSLRLRLQIRQTAGKIDVKKENVNLLSAGSEVQEIFAEPMTGEIPGFVIDLILSGNSDIFPSDKIDICTFRVENAGTDAQAAAEITVIGSSYEIVNSTGTQKSIPVGDVSAHITLEPSDDHMETPPVTPDPSKPEDNPDTPDGPFTPGPAPTEAPVEPVIPEPTPTEIPVEPVIPNPKPTKVPVPEPTMTPIPDKTPFNPSAGTKISAGKAKSGTARVTLTWEKKEGADGYQIYWYNRGTKKYIKLKTITNPSVTTYTTKNFSYGQSQRFKIRAFSVNRNGKRTYGKFGPSIKIRTGPSATSIKSLKSAEKRQAVITWKTVSRADGYQIYRSTSKNGTYKKLKTSPGNTSFSITLKNQRSKKTFYYKIRAYVVGSDGKRVYGKFTAPKALKIK